MVDTKAMTEGMVQTKATVAMTIGRAGTTAMAELGRENGKEGKVGNGGRIHRMVAALAAR